MQKKQIIQFTVLLVLILALTGAYFGIRSFQSRQDAEKEKEEAAAVIALTSFEPEDVSKISYDYEGKTYTFEKDGDQWVEKGNGKTKLDQDLFEDFVQSAGEITADTEVPVNEDSNEQEDYGFGQPSRTVAVTAEDETVTLIFGSRNEMLSQYYVKKESDSRIYLVEESVYTAFDKTTEDFEKEETDTDTDSADEETKADTDSVDGETKADTDSADEETKADTDSADGETGTDAE